MQRLLLLILALLALALTSMAANIPEAQSQAAPTADSPVQKFGSGNADPSWRPSSEQRAAISAMTRAYFSARDSNRADDAYAFMSPTQKQHVPFSGYKTMLGEFNSKAGPVQSRVLRAVTWYKDTPQGRGLFVAVDYSSDFTNLALHCGYLVWQEQEDGSFLITREEANMIDRDTMTKLSPEMVANARKMFRC